MLRDERLLTKTPRSNEHGTLSRRFPHRADQYQFTTQASPLKQVAKLGALLIIAGCCGLLGMHLCAVCAQPATAQASTWRSSPAFFPATSAIFAAELDGALTSPVKGATSAKAIITLK